MKYSVRNLYPGDLTEQKRRILMFTATQNKNCIDWKNLIAKKKRKGKKV